MPYRDHEIELDFVDDWKESMRGFYRARSLEVPDDHALGPHFFTLQLRLVSATPRTVRRARGLQVPSQVRKGFDWLRTKLRKGYDVEPHLSRLVAVSGSKDLMINDWGIHHFHLGVNYEADGRVARTGPLLFARVLPAEVFLLAISDHGSWTELALLETWLANWPDDIRRYRMNGVVGLARPTTEAEVRALRKKHANVLLELSDGGVYCGPGGGITGAGTALVGTRRSIFVNKRLASWETSVVDAKETLRPAIDSEPVKPVRFHFRTSNGEAYLTNRTGRRITTLAGFWKGVP